MNITCVMFVIVYYRHIVTYLRGMIMRKVNSVVAILKLLAVFVLLTDLAFITFFLTLFLW